MEIAVSVDRLMHKNGQFNGKDVSRFLQNYKAKILRCGISDRMQDLLSFNRISMDGLQGNIHDL